MSIGDHDTLGISEEGEDVREKKKRSELKKVMRSGCNPTTNVAVLGPHGNRVCGTSLVCHSEFRSVKQTSYLP